MTKEADSKFVGSIPQYYDRYLGPLLFEPFAVDLAARTRVPADNGSVLEIAAGTGILTTRLHSTLPATTRLTVTDLNEPMLGIAKAKLTSGDSSRSVVYRQADAMQLPFGDSEFDSVVCQFGVMFFPDKNRAAAEAARVLRPGGQWLFNVWGSLDENPFSVAVQETIVRFFPIDAPGFFRVPFGFSNPADLRAVVTGAGFSEPEIATLDRVLESPSAADAAAGFIKGTPLVDAIAERGTVGADEIADTLASRLAEEFGDKPLRIPSRIRVVSADKRS